MHDICLLSLIFFSTGESIVSQSDFFQDFNKYTQNATLLDCLYLVAYLCIQLYNVLILPPYWRGRCY